VDLAELLPKKQWRLKFGRIKEDLGCAHLLRSFEYREDC
jgi:hypothetical protein